MFFQTQLKTIGAGGAVDMQGRRLAFIGYLPVQAGDWVFTDGTVIFGNSPPKGAPAPPPNPLSGVPVLSDFDSIGASDLRGYFTASGAFKRFAVKQDDWIANSKEKFFHGLNAFNSGKVIDADTTDTGDKVIVTDGLYREVSAREIGCVIVRFNSTHMRYFSDTGDYQISAHIYRWPQILGVKDYSTDEPVKLFVNGALKKSLDLRPYAADVQKRALQIAQRIMAQSYTGDGYTSGKTPLPYMQPEMLYYAYRHYFSQPNDLLKAQELAPTLAYPGDPFLAYTVAYVQTSNISGTNFGGTVYASTYGYCFPFIKPRLSLGVFREDFDPDTLWGDGKDPDVIARNELIYNTWIDHFGNRRNSQGYYGGYFQLREWLCVPFGVSCIYPIAEGGVIKPVAVHSAGVGGIRAVAFDSSGEQHDALSALKDKYTILPRTYNDFYPYSYHAWETRPLAFATSAEEFEWTDLLPVGNGFYSLDKFGRLSFYDSERNKVAENFPVNDNFCNVEIDWNSFSMQEKSFRATAARKEARIKDGQTVIETVAEQVYTTYRFQKNGITVEQDAELFNHKPDTVHHTVYTPDGKQKSGLTENNGVKLPAPPGGTSKFAEEATDVSGYGGGVKDDVYHSKVMDIDFLPVDGYYIKKDETLEPLQFTPLFYQFRKGAYLYGVRGGKLYLKVGDTVTLIGNGVKNFRFRELKNMSKARR